MDWGALVRDLQSFFAGDARIVYPAQQALSSTIFFLLGGLTFYVVYKYIVPDERAANDMKAPNFHPLVNLFIGFVFALFAVIVVGVGIPGSLDVFGNLIGQQDRVTTAIIFIATAIIVFVGLRWTTRRYNRYMEKRRASTVTQAVVPVVPTGTTVVTPSNPATTTPPGHGP